MKHIQCNTCGESIRFEITKEMQDRYDQLRRDEPRCPFEGRVADDIRDAVAAALDASWHIIHGDCEENNCSEFYKAGWEFKQWKIEADSRLKKKVDHYMKREDIEKAASEGFDFYDKSWMEAIADFGVKIANSVREEDASLMPCTSEEACKTYWRWSRNEHLDNCPARFGAMILDRKIKE